MNFFKVLPIFIIGGLLFGALQSPAGGSRVGNGNGDNGGKKIILDKSFEIETPIPFTQIKEYADGFKIEGPVKVKMRRGPIGLIPTIENQSIKVMRLREQRPQLALLSKQQLLEYFKTRKWESLSSVDECAVAQKITNENYTTIVVTWGNEDGYMIAADNTIEATSAAEAMVKSTKIKMGCQWK